MSGTAVGTAPGLSIAREAAISFVINGVLSLVFFLALFGRSGASLHWGAPDALAIDFLPQSLAVSLMSALVPALIARRRLGRGTGLRPIFHGAAIFAALGLLLGAVLAAAAEGLGTAPVDWWAALAFKLLYGGLLGAGITIMALRRMVR